MRLYIDNRLADIDQDEQILISLSIASLTKIENGKMGYSKSIRIPMTRNNMQIMGDPDQVNAAVMYNQANHTARIEVDGFTVIDGTLQLVACRTENQTGWYVLNIIGAGKRWVKDATESGFKDIGIVFNETITPITIYQSWSWNKPVRFLPVQRERDFVENRNNHAFAPTRVLAFEDYHPFLHAKTLVDQIMANAGYRIVSEFMESEYFKSFYISGRYPTKDVDLVRARMDFRAGRFANTTAKADRLGRVMADSAVTTNSVGNVVDTANPNETPAGGGAPIEGVYCINNCFQKIGNMIHFVPTTEVMIGFEYGFRYTTDYYLLSRTELKGFNQIYLDDMQTHKYKITNRFADRRDRIMAGYMYNIFVFDYVAGTSYQFRYKLLTNPNADLDNLLPSDYTIVTFSTFSARVKMLVIIGALTILETYLYAKKSSESTYTTYSGDWAIYDNSVAERGTIEVEVTVRSAPSRVLPSKPKYFSGIYFGGANEGMNFTLHKTTTLKPIFSQNPAQGATVNFGEVAAHEIKQIDFINSLKQLFNLYFYTDNLNKEVYVEPREMFYDNSTIVDWCHKIDYSKPIEVQELGADMNEIITLQYRDGDGTVARWNETYQQKFGRWRSRIGNKFARQGEKIYENPILTPAMNKADVYPDAPDALLLQVGDRDRYVNTESEDLNFAPKMVRYTGLVQLPPNQIWGWPSDATKYPALFFHYAGRNNTYAGEEPNPLASFSDNPQVLIENGMSLCFEDRDGVAGMHQFYDSNIDLYNSSKRVVLHLNLTAEDIEALIVPNSLKRDFRARFRLKIDGETSLFFLEEVCDYAPNANRSTKCIFTKDV